MKTLSTLAVLTAATAAQAYTLDVNVGHSRLDNYDNVSVVGLGIGSQGGIRPFIGAGVGGVRFSGDSIDTKTAFATKLFLGISFPITPNVEFTLTAQNSKFYSVQELAGGPKTNITSWDGIAGLRFNF